jgi:hypothetical protein
VSKDVGSRRQLFIDDDVGHHPQTMAEMRAVRTRSGALLDVPLMLYQMKTILDHDLNICAGYYCARRPPHRPLVFRKVEKDGHVMWTHINEPPKSGVEEVDAVATGFLCIKREVFQRMQEEFDRRLKITEKYREWWNKEQSQELKTALPADVSDYLTVCKPDLHPPFWMDYVYDPFHEQWKPIGEDIYFCREAQKLGFKIYVDFSVELGHKSDIMITPAHYRHSYQEDAIEAEKSFLRKMGLVEETTDDGTAGKPQEDSPGETEG